MVLPLPSGKTQFLDSAGNPLAAGLVYHYVPNTSTPKTTWQDIDGTVTNSNPIILDAAGEAVIFGNGAYRQVVTDSLGTQIWDQDTQVATLSLLGAVAIAGDTMTGTLIVPSLSVTGGQDLTIAPTANPTISTVSSFSVQGSTQSTTKREFLGAFGFTSTLGEGLTGGNQDRVTLYAGMDLRAGSGDAWSLNTVLTMEASGSATANAIGYELDFNNLLDHRGDIAGGGGFAAPVAYGLAVTGAGDKRSTAAILISGPGVSPIWNRGIAFANASVSQATFQDFTASTTSLEIFNAHTYGLDMQDATFSGAGILFGNGTTFKSRNAADNADLAVFVQSGDNLILGDASTLGIYSRNLVAPFTDNSVTSGSATNRWSAVWAVNGTIQTSDPALKRDIQPLSKINSGDIIDHIRPISFRWIDGGFDEVDDEEVARVPVVEWSEWTEQKTEMRDGVPTVVTVRSQREVPVYDDLPAFNQDGTPAFISVPGAPAVYNDKGQMIRAEVKPRQMRAMHREPRMQTVKRTVKRLVPREGRRTHWGFDAEQIRAIAELAKIDFGGFVQAEDGTLAYRPDQMLPIVWEELRRLRKRVAQLEGRKS